VCVCVCVFVCVCVCVFACVNVSVRVRLDRFPVLPGLAFLTPLCRCVDTFLLGAHFNVFLYWNTALHYNILQHKSLTLLWRCSDTFHCGNWLIDWSVSWTCTAWVLINTSRLTWTSHVTCESVMSLIKQQLDVHSVSAYESITSPMSEKCHVWMSPVTHKAAAGHAQRVCVWIHHVANKKKMSRATYEWVLSRLNRPLDVTAWVLMNQSRRTWVSPAMCEWDISPMTESCHI